MHQDICIQRGLTEEDIEAAATRKRRGRNIPPRIPRKKDSVSKETRKSSIGNESLYNRGHFRKSTLEKMVREAPRDSYGNIICPTCSKVIQDKIVVNTKNGPKERRGYDGDHYPVTWEKRIKSMKTLNPPPTRKEVLDAYNSDVRLQCPECNQSHIFEGVKGEYADGKK